MRARVKARARARVRARARADLAAGGGCLVAPRRVHGGHIHVEHDLLRGRGRVS